MTVLITFGVVFYVKKSKKKGSTMRHPKNVKIIPTTTMTAVNNVPPLEAGEVDDISHC